MLTKEKTAEIRKKLKVLGWNSRQVSVRCSHGSLYVTVKDPSVPKHQVAVIANKHENVRRCEFSGDILSGGNTFVTVEYDRELVRTRAAELEPLLSDEEGKPAVVQGFEVWKEKNGYQPGAYCICKADDNLNANQRAYNKASAAEALAVILMDKGFEHCGQWVSA